MHNLLNLRSKIWTMKIKFRNNQNNNWLIPALFVIVSYSITWSILFPLSLVYNELDIVEREIWHSFGSIGPSIGGITALYLSKKQEGLELLKERTLKYPGYKFLILAFSPLIILFIVLIFEWLFGFFKIVTFLQENNITNFGTFVIFILPSLCYGFFEEIGWRGYFLPKLQSKFNALISTIILTIIWWFWHFPAFFYRFDLFFALVLMLPLMLTGSIIFTFLFNQSKGSILMVIILHICYDIVTSHQISITAIILVSTFFIFMDIRILKIYGSENLSSLNKITL
jgi:membrane protease YdiL (CAAX protease family)